MSGVADDRWPASEALALSRDGIDSGGGTAPEALALSTCRESLRSSVARDARSLRCLLPPGRVESARPSSPPGRGFVSRVVGLTPPHPPALLAPSGRSGARPSRAGDGWPAAQPPARAHWTDGGARTSRAAGRPAGSENRKRASATAGGAGASAPCGAATALARGGVGPLALRWNPHVRTLGRTSVSWRIRRARASEAALFPASRLTSQPSEQATLREPTNSHRRRVGRVALAEPSRGTITAPGWPDPLDASGHGVSGPGIAFESRGVRDVWIIEIWTDFEMNGRNIGVGCGVVGSKPIFTPAEPFTR